MDFDDVSREVLARMETLEPAVTILDGEVKTTPAGGYAVFYDDTPVLSAGRLSGQQDRMRWTGSAVAAGRDAAEARWVLRKLINCLSGYRFATDRGTGWISVDPEPSPLIRDSNVSGDIRFSHTLAISVHTTRSVTP